MWGGTNLENHVAKFSYVHDLSSALLPGPWPEALPLGPQTQPADHIGISLEEKEKSTPSSGSANLPLLFPLLLISLAPRRIIPHRYFMVNVIDSYTRALVIQQEATEIKGGTNRTEPRGETEQAWRGSAPRRRCHGLLAKWKGDRREWEGIVG